MILVRGLCVFMLISTLGVPVFAAAFHVALEGDDAGPGTVDQPFATLEKAQEAVRELRARSGALDQPVVVYVHGGEYLVTRTLALTQEDSGTQVSPTIWQGLPGAQVRFLGGRRLTGFQPVTEEAVVERLREEAREHVVQVDLGALGVRDLGQPTPVGGPLAQLVCNGKYMTLARFPDEGDWLRISGIPEGKEGEPKTETPYASHWGRFAYDSERPGQWKDIRGVWVHGYWVWNWSDAHYPVLRLDSEKREVWPEPPYDRTGFHYGLRTGQRFYFLNVLEELDSPGEWYLDRERKLLYFWPPEPLDSAEVLFTEFDKPMISLTETKHVHIRGIAFEASRDAAVVISGGAHNEIAGCTMRYLGGRTAVSISGEYNGIRSCDVYGVSGRGIELNGGDRKSLTPGHNYAVNCELHDWGQVWRTYHGAVTLNGVGHRVAQCSMHDAPHTAVFFSGNDHVIEFNDIGRVCMETDDAGAIYNGRDFTQRGTVARHNYIHELGTMGVCSFYLDDNLSGQSFVGNVVYKAMGVWVGGGRDNLVENNIFVESNPGVSIGLRGPHPDYSGNGGQILPRLEAMNVQQPPYSERYPELVNLLEDEPHVPKGNRINRNISVGGSLASIPESVRDAIEVRDNFTEGDPGFVDAENQDFRLREDSPALALGFEPIPMEQIGLHVDAYRTFLRAAAPAIVAPQRSFVGEIEVRMGCRTQGAVTRYTLDGSEPGPSSPRYQGPITLAQTTAVKAVAYDAREDPRSRSATVSATFTGYQLGSAEGVALSALEPLECAVSGQLLRDLSYGGVPLSLGGRQFTTGLITHPRVEGPAEVVYALDGGLRQAERFVAWVGVDDTAGKVGSCRFVVEIRVNGVWERVFESETLRGGGAPAEVDVALRGADRLRLIANDAGDDRYSDHAAWCGAVLR